MFVNNLCFCRSSTLENTGVGYFISKYFDVILWSNYNNLIHSFISWNKKKSFPSAFNLFFIMEIDVLVLWCQQFSYIFQMKSSKDFLSAFSVLIHFLQYEFKALLITLQHSFPSILEGGRYFGLFWRKQLLSRSWTMLRSPVIIWPLGSYRNLKLLQSKDNGELLLMSISVVSEL